MQKFQKLRANKPRCVDYVNDRVALNCYRPYLRLPLLRYPDNQVVCRKGYCLPPRDGVQNCGALQMRLLTWFWPVSRRLERLLDATK